MLFLVGRQDGQWRPVHRGGEKAERVVLTLRECDRPSGFRPYRRRRL